MTGKYLLDLDDQAALVTGGGQGAGRAIALMLARHNAGGVAVNDFVAERAEAVAAEIEALGVRAVAIQTDVGDHASVSAAFAKARAVLGPITLLVNNAGNAGPEATMGYSPPFWETSPADWDRFARANLNGVMNCCHMALPEMVAQARGRIVTIVSDSGRIGEARLSAYAAATAGAAGFVGFQIEGRVWHSEHRALCLWGAVCGIGDPGMARCTSKIGDPHLRATDRRNVTKRHAQG